MLIYLIFNQYKIKKIEFKNFKDYQINKKKLIVLFVNDKCYCNEFKKMYKLLTLEVSSIDFKFKPLIVNLKEEDYEEYIKLGITYTPTIGIFNDKQKYIFKKLSDLSTYKEYTFEIIGKKLKKFKNLLINKSILYCNWENNEITDVKYANKLLIKKTNIFYTKDLEICNRYGLKNNQFFLRVDDSIFHYTKLFDYESILNFYFYKIYKKEKYLSHDLALELKIYQFPIILVNNKNKNFISIIENNLKKDINIFLYKKNYFKNFFEWFIDVQLIEKINGILFLDLKNNYKIFLKNGFGINKLYKFLDKINNKDYNDNSYYHSKKIEEGKFLFKNIYSDIYYDNIYIKNINFTRIILFYFSLYDERSIAFANQLKMLNEKNFNNIKFFKIDLLNNEIKGFNSDPKLICYPKNSKTYKLFISFILLKDIKEFINECNGIEIKDEL